MVSDQQRAWLQTVDRLYLMPSGAIDLLRLFDALKAAPASLRAYIDLSRRLRADRKAR